MTLEELEAMAIAVANISGSDDALVGCECEGSGCSDSGIDCSDDGGDY